MTKLSCSFLYFRGNPGYHRTHGNPMHIDFVYTLANSASAGYCYFHRFINITHQIRSLEAFFGISYNDYK